MGLLASRRFLPLFVAQAAGAMNDNLFKNALAVWVLFASVENGPMLVAAAGGVFILPYVLFSSLAGELAEQHEKASLIRATKLWELGLMLLAAAGFWLGSVGMLMAVLFGLGVQATFFSPLKYGILPAHLRREELLLGNGLVEAGTFIGILAGTIAGGALIMGPGGRAIVSVAGIALALAGIAAARAIPLAPASAPGLRLGWNILAESLALVRLGRSRAEVWVCILGIAWFWGIGALVLIAFPVIARDTLGGDAHLVTLMLTVFSIGVGIGSIGCARLLHGALSARHAPLAALGISLFALDFAMACGSAGALPTIGAVFAAFTGWRLLLDLLFLSVCGGVFSVPLYAVLQARAAPSELSRLIGCNNIVNAAYMVVAAAAAAALAGAGIAAPQWLTLMATANFGVAVWLRRQIRRLEL